MAQQTMFHLASVYGVSISSTAQTMTDIGFTAAQLAKADVMRITVEDAAIRTKEDGDAPTATEGHPLAFGADVNVYGRAIIADYQFIRQSTDATINVTLYSESHP